MFRRSGVPFRGETGGIIKDPAIYARICRETVAARTTRNAVPPSPRTGFQKPYVFRHQRHARDLSDRSRTLRLDCRKGPERVFPKECLRIVLESTLQLIRETEAIRFLVLLLLSWRSRPLRGRDVSRNPVRNADSLRLAGPRLGQIALSQATAGASESRELLPIMHVQNACPMLKYNRPIDSPGRRSSLNP